MLYKKLKRRALIIIWKVLYKLTLILYPHLSDGTLVKRGYGLFDAGYKLYDISGKDPELREIALKTMALGLVMGDTAAIRMGRGPVLKNKLIQLMYYPNKIEAK